jgi:hypothetical protein
MSAVTATFGTLTFFSTKPLRRQRVQTLMVLVVPSIVVFILRIFGLHVRCVWLNDLLTLLPCIGAFPQISQVLDIFLPTLLINT